MKLFKMLAGFAGFVAITMIGYVFVAAVDLYARMNGVYAYSDYPHLLRFMIIASSSILYWIMISSYDTFLRWAGSNK